MNTENNKSEALNKTDVISCNNTAKEKLSQKLESITKESKNLKLLNEYFGEDNLKKLPFKNIEIGGLYTNSWDGSHTLEVYFQNGRVHQSCSVSDVGDILIGESELKIIEKAIHEKLDKL